LNVVEIAIQHRIAAATDNETRRHDGGRPLNPHEASFMREGSAPNALFNPHYKPS
jgi:hypothetical protein